MGKTAGKILIVDDNEELLYALKLFLTPHFSAIDTVKNPEQIVSTIQGKQYDVVLLDMNFSAGINSGNEGLYWLSRIREADPTLSVVFITAYGDMELAVNAMKEGAADFIHKSWDEHKILSSVLSAYKQRLAKAEIRTLLNKQKHLAAESQNGFTLIGCKSAPMLQVLKTIEKVAPTDANILITGESGAGKELVARAIHSQSHRKNQLFVVVDLGSLSPTLFESELFGHRKGAFTDAKDDKLGRFEMASEGTLFLDEIGNIPPHLQAKLLTAIQSKEVTPLGATHPTAVDVRIVSATNTPIAELAQSSHFREDLYYRLNTITIEVPPLRQRKDDIPELIHFFASKYAQRYNKEDVTISSSVLKSLCEYSWPGNVRELQHKTERAVILSNSTELSLPDFGIEHQNTVSSNPYNLAHNERQVIASAIKHCNGNLKQAAQELGINRSTLYDKIKKYGL
ncbi:MAG: sigma-54 dependent transcriptional regulator, partial [Tenuifilaceae bacterium]|jgi:DNA-binding NtrC family response regulator|nr:sigma-54 dependent transcriptional regulator [Tenuifilaceae bacterium]